MRKLLLAVLIAVSLVAAYLAMPFVAAAQIRQAARIGDTGTLARKVEWPSVRESLKASLAVLAREKDVASRRLGLPAPGLWQRIKMAAAPAFADTFVDRYVTPEGVAQLVSAKAAFKALGGGAIPRAPAGADGESHSAFAAADMDSADALERFVAFVARLRRAVIHSPTKVELEIADRNVPNRRYVSILEFKRLDWKLTSVRVVGEGF